MINKETIVRFVGTTVTGDGNNGVSSYDKFVLLPTLSRDVWKICQTKRNESTTLTWAFFNKRSEARQMMKMIVEHQANLREKVAAVYG